VIYEVRPDFVVEAGRAAVRFSGLCSSEQVKPNGGVITIDVTDTMEEARRLPVVQRRVDFLALVPCGLRARSQAT
jgi:hypothetical protein